MAGGRCLSPPGLPLDDRLWQGSSCNSHKRSYLTFGVTIGEGPVLAHRHRCARRVEGPLEVSNLLAATHLDERPESARLAHCPASPRGSPDSTDSGRSASAAGTRPDAPKLPLIAQDKPGLSRTDLYKAGKPSGAPDRIGHAYQSQS